MAIDFYLTMRADDSELICRGSTAYRRCSRCNQVVIVSPEGRRVIDANAATIRIVCNHCVTPDMMQGPWKFCGNEHDAVPNTHRNRN